MVGLRTVLSQTVQALGTCYNQTITFSSYVLARGKRILDRLLVNETTQFHATQFIEGFKMVVNFPFSMLKTPLYEQPRTLMAHVGQYNGLYYLLPVVSYQAFIRQFIVKALGEPYSNYMIGVDLLVDALFFRALTNAYVSNIFNNINAASISMTSVDIDANKPKCLCRESLHVRGAVMSPVYYLGKVATSLVLGRLPKVGFIFDYTLKPLAWGESLAEVNLSGLCNDHRISYFSTHNTSNYGIGMAVLATVKTTTGVIYYFTGIHGFFLEDAIFNFLFPFMINHMRNTEASRELQEETSIDLFYPVRETINHSLARIAGVIIPRLMLAEKDNQVAQYLKSVVTSKPLEACQAVLFYRHIRTNPEEIIKFSPLNFLLKMNFVAIEQKLNTIELVITYPQTVKGALSIYGLLPFVPPKEHTAFVVDLLTKDVEQTKELVKYFRNLLHRAMRYKPNRKPASRVTQFIPMKEIDLQASYMSPQSSHPPSNPLQVEDFEMIDSGRTLLPQYQTLQQSAQISEVSQHPIAPSEKAVESNAQQIYIFEDYPHNTNQSSHTYSWQKFKTQ